MRHDRSPGNSPPRHDISEASDGSCAHPAGGVETSGGIHDLHNLLAVIIGVCESLADDLDQRPEQRELARIGVLATDRAAKMVSAPRAIPAEGAPAEPAWEPAPEAAPVTDLAGRRSALRLAAAADPRSGDDDAKRVLIVEDDPDLLLLLTAAFVREGFKTYIANNGRKGLDLLRTLKPDLMITDIIMPEMEGIGTMLEAKRCAPGLKVIAISGGGHYGRSQDFLDWARELGADEVLAKPFRVSSLVMAARVVLDRPPPTPDRPAVFERGAPEPARLLSGR